jgi:hypothetical protein
MKQPGLQNSSKMIQASFLAGMWLPEWRLTQLNLRAKYLWEVIPESGTLIAPLFFNIRTASWKWSAA